MRVQTCAGVLEFAHVTMKHCSSCRIQAYFIVGLGRGCNTVVQINNALSMTICHCHGYLIGYQSSIGGVSLIDWRQDGIGGVSFIKWLQKTLPPTFFQAMLSGKELVHKAVAARKMIECSLKYWCNSCLYHYCEIQHKITNFFLAAIPSSHTIILCPTINPITPTATAWFRFAVSCFGVKTLSK